MKGFYDIEGTEICQGDVILYADTWGNNQPKLLDKFRVVGFTPKFCKIEKIKEGKLYWHEKTKIMIHRTPDRILIMKGEFKKYTKDEILPGS